MDDGERDRPVESPAEGKDKKTAKQDRRRVQAAGRQLDRAQRRHRQGIDRINREIESVRQARKLASLWGGNCCLFEDRVEIGRARFPLDDPHLHVEVAASGNGDRTKVHLTLSSSAGVKTVSLPGRQESAARTYAAAIRQAVASYEEVHRNKAATIRRLEADAAHAEADVQDIQTARTALFDEETRTGLTYTPVRWKLRAIGAAAATLAILATIGALSEPETETSTASSSQSATVTPTTTTAKITTARTTAPATTAPSTAQARPTTTKAEPRTPKTTPKPTSRRAEPSKSPKAKPTEPKQPKIAYEHLTQREWALIARDPDSHIGEAIVVYGVVTQADSITGAQTIRADIGGVKDTPDYFGYSNYPTNTIVTSDKVDLGELVEDDIFRARVIVMGSQQYETTLGGYLTVPTIEMKRGWRIGHQPD
ncbi:hypothetical protein KIH74_06875 [Kineosporia sp. J2-2]|uniref:Uncharacterized protein n=1 Tax=Kineosporia corallincola TaxID=2835133 RepID=A0ABS5TEX3_9ACTN|nr:hypothetical protein [Kineosporia corallincola]MBT0768643.1 hypothetical protein [Kineosporia corallincola]